MAGTRPPEIDAALSVLEGLEEAQAKVFKQPLTVLASKLARAGETVTEKLLQDYVDQGLDAIKEKTESLGQAKKKKQKTYEEIVASFEDAQSCLVETTPLPMSQDGKLTALIKDDNLEGVKRHIKNSGGFRHADGLKIAAENGYLEMTKYLCEQSDYVDFRATEALGYAAKNGHLEVVKYLCEKGADIRSHNGLALKNAAENRHLDVVKYLHEQDGSMQIAVDWVLWRTAQYGYLEMVEYLCEQGARIHPGGGGAITAAAENGHLEVLQYLCAQEGSVDIKKDSALIKAAGNGYLDMVKYLHERDPGILANRGRDALRCAAQNGHLEVLQYLCEQSVDIYTKIHEAFVMAAQVGHLDIVRYLHEQGVDISAKEDDAFIAAAMTGNIDIVRYLYEQGADIHARDDFALRGATQRNQFEVMDYLCGQGADINILSEGSQRFYKNYQLWYNIHQDCDLAASFISCSPYFYKPNVYKAVLPMIEAEGYKNVTAQHYAYHISSLFGSEERVLQYLERWGEAGKQPLHDIAHMIKLPPEGRPDLKAWGDAVLKHGPKLAKFVNFSGRMKQPEKDAAGQGWSYTKTKERIAEFAYKDGYKNPVLASFCLDNGWHDHNFTRALDLIEEYKKKYAVNDNAKPGGRIPDVAIDGEAFDKEGYRFYKLPDGDVRGLLLGEFTNCCQHLAGAAASCAEHGFLSEESGFYVVEDKKTEDIVAQSWAWRGEGGELVFDSLESLSGHFNERQWENLMSVFAKEAVNDEKADISAVHIGGGATPSLTFNQAALPVKPVDGKCYPDSEFSQYVVLRR